MSLIYDTFSYLSIENVKKLLWNNFKIQTIVTNNSKNKVGGSDLVISIISDSHFTNIRTPSYCLILADLIKSVRKKNNLSYENVGKKVWSVA